MLDQHLLDPVVGRALVARTDVGTDELVLDVGAGTGALTDAILRRRPRGVIAVEPDPRCRPWLTGRPGVELRPVRVQDLDVRDLADVTMIIANPPFSVLQHVITLARRLPRLRACFEPAVLTAVPGAAFVPPISVPAAWLRLLPHPDPDPMIMLLVDAIRRRGGLRLKDFLRSPRLPCTHSRRQALRSDPVLRRLQQRRLAALTRADLAQLARRLQHDDACE